MLKLATPSGKTVIKNMDEKMGEPLIVHMRNGRMMPKFLHFNEFWVGRNEAIQRRLPRVQMFLSSFQFSTLKEPVKYSEEFQIPLCANCSLPIPVEVVMFPETKFWDIALVYNDYGYDPDAGIRAFNRKVIEAGGKVQQVAPWIGAKAGRHVRWPVLVEEDKFFPSIKATVALYRAQAMKEAIKHLPVAELRQYGFKGRTKAQVIDNIEPTLIGMVG